MGRIPPRSCLTRASVNSRPRCEIRRMRDLLQWSQMRPLPKPSPACFGSNFPRLPLLGKVAWSRTAWKSCPIFCLMFFVLNMTCLSKLELESCNWLLTSGCFWQRDERWDMSHVPTTRGWRTRIWTELRRILRTAPSLWVLWPVCGYLGPKRARTSAEEKRNVCRTYVYRPGPEKPKNTAILLFKLKKCSCKLTFWVLYFWSCTFSFFNILRMLRSLVASFWLWSVRGRRRVSLAQNPCRRSGPAFWECRLKIFLPWIVLRCKRSTCAQVIWCSYRLDIWWLRKLCTTMMWD